MSDNDLWVTNDIWAAIEKYKADNPFLQEAFDAYTKACEAFEATLPKTIITTTDSSDVWAGGVK